jgi:hypothetical protein
MTPGSGDGMKGMMHHGSYSEPSLLHGAESVESIRTYTSIYDAMYALLSNGLNSLSWHLPDDHQIMASSGSRS